MRHSTRLILIAAVTAFALSGCAAEPTEPAPDAPAVTDESTPNTGDNTDQQSGDDGDSGGSSAGAEVTIPDGAVAGSVEFPFPVPQEWTVIEPFAQTRIGKTPAMYAIYEFPGDAETAAASYLSLLREAGVVADDYPLGAVTNDASLVVTTATVAGQAYAGTIDFATDAAGVQRASINLSED